MIKPNKVNAGIASLLLLGASLMGVSGCATMPVNNSLNYEFLDSQGEQKLIKKNNDLYVEKLDGSGSRRITFTPDIEEFDGEIRGNYITYLEQTGWSNQKYYVQSIDKEERREINQTEFYSLQGR